MICGARQSEVLRCAGISETVIMKIGGWKTRSAFERYTIVDRGDIAEAMQMLENNRREPEGPVIGHGEKSASIRPPEAVTTWGQWRRLSLSQKSDLIKQNPGIQATLKQNDVPAQPFGAKVNTKGLEKIAELRKRSGRSAK